MLAHPLSVYSPKNHSPIWGYMFLAGCAYVVLKKDNSNLALPSAISNPLIEENTSIRNQMLYDKMFAELVELQKYLGINVAVENYMKSVITRLFKFYHTTDQVAHILRLFRAMYVYQMLENNKYLIKKLFKEEHPESKKMEKIYNKLIGDMRKIVKAATISKDKGYNAIKHSQVTKFLLNEYLDDAFANAKKNNISEILNFDISRFYSVKKLEEAVRKIENKWIEEQTKKEK